MNKEIQDNLNFVHDGYEIKGHVIIFMNGKKIFESDNMIVQNGRDYLRNLFLKELKEFAPSLQFPEAGCFVPQKIRFGSKEGATILDSKISTDNGNFFDIVLGSDSRSSITYEAAPNNRLKISLSNISGDGVNNGSLTIRELGLVDAEGNTFSRVALDPIPLQTNTSFSLFYYIYF